MEQHHKHTWLAWDAELVYVRDEKRGNVVFKPEEDKEREIDEYERGFVAISNDREIFVEDEQLFAVTFENESPVHDVSETGIYNKYGQLLINVQHH